MRLLFALVLSLLIVGPALAETPERMTIKETRKGYVTDISYPRFKQAAVDRQIEEWARGVAKDFAETSRESTGVPNPWSAEVDYDVIRNDAQMIVVGFRYYTYTGGAHPNSSTETFNFLMPDGRRVEFAEVFSQKGVRRVSDISIAQLKQDLGGPEGMGDFDWIKRGAGPNAKNFSSFALLPRELQITFDSYQVAPYAAGPQEVRIALSNLRDVMRPNPRLPAASFDCRLARTDIERAICGSTELARLDRHLGEAYADKLVWAEDAAKLEALRAQQRAWLKARDAACRGSAMAACLSQMYVARQKALESP